MELTPELKEQFMRTAESLRGSERRIYMARITKMLGIGGQRRAESELRWNRGTIRKGMKELQHGPIKDNFSARGRKSAEYHFPNLLTDIEDLISEQKLSARRVRQLLVHEKGYSDSALPSAETIRKKMKLVQAR